MTTFLDAFLPQFKRHLAHAKFYKCLIYEWDGKQRVIITNKTSYRRNCIRNWIIIHGAYITFQFFTLFLGKHELTDRFVGVLLLSLYCFCFAFRSEIEPDSAPIENLNRRILGIGMIIIFKLTWVQNLFFQILSQISTRLWSCF